MPRPTRIPCRARLRRARVSAAYDAFPSVAQVELPVSATIRAYPAFPWRARRRPAQVCLRALRLPRDRLRDYGSIRGAGAASAVSFCRPSRCLSACKWRRCFLQLHFTPSADGPACPCT
jgi:hypothetical protein